MNLLMLLNNLWDNATLSVATGTEVPTLPLTHSQTYGRSRTAAITPDGAGTSVLEFDLDALTLANGLVLNRHWLSDIATWQLELFDGAGQSGNLVYDSGEVECTLTKTLGELDWLVDPLVSSVFDDWPYKFSQLWFDGVFAASGRITINDTNARDGIHEFDRVYLGRAFSPTFNFSYDHSHEWESQSEQRRTAAGSTFAADRIRTRRMTFSLDYLNEQERPLLSEAFRQVGTTRDFFISMFPGQGGKKEVEYAMACKRHGSSALTANFFNNFRTPITVVEA